MRAIAIYDLDRTVLTHATFTPFLLFAARRRAPWRLLFTPVWLVAMLAYKSRLFSRGALKQFGLRIFLGSKVTEAQLRRLGGQFADHVIPDWLAPGATRAMEIDREKGRELVLATAAMGFYARPIGERLGFAQVISTTHLPLDAPGAVRLAGENCYGAEKIERIAAFLTECGTAREECELRFYSDSISDAPLLGWVDHGILVDPGKSGHARAAVEGWEVMRFCR